MAIWITTSVWSYRIKLLYLVLLLPALTIVTLVLSFYIIHWSFNKAFFEDFFLSLFFLVPIITWWLLIWILFQRRIIFWFTWAKTVTRKDNPEIYNLIENLCISRWLITPRIGIIDHPWLNAFATGWSKNDSWIVFTRWILNQLNEKEIEAVAAHELTHIINKDVRHMIVINLYIGIILTIWFFFMRASFPEVRANWRPRWGFNWVLFVLGVMLYLLWLIILPLISLAISRKKEYIADAWAVQLTKDPDALISALRKISRRSFVASVESKWRNVASMFIYTPRRPQEHQMEFRSLFSTHPSLDERIKAIKRY